MIFPPKVKDIVPLLFKRTNSVQSEVWIGYITLFQRLCLYTLSVYLHEIDTIFITQGAKTEPEDNDDDDDDEDQHETEKKRNPTSV